MWNNYSSLRFVYRNLITQWSSQPINCRRIENVNSSLWGGRHFYLFRFSGTIIHFCFWFGTWLAEQARRAYRLQSDGFLFRWKSANDIGGQKQRTSAVRLQQFQEPAQLTVALQRITPDVEMNQFFALHWSFLERVEAVVAQRQRL